MFHVYVYVFSFPPRISNIFASVGCMVMSVLLFLFELDCKYLSIYTVDSVCQTPFRVFLAGGVGLTFVAGLC